MESVDLGHGGRKHLVLMKIRFVRERLHAALAGHCINVLALRLDQGLLLVRQGHEPLEDGVHLRFIQLVEGDVVQDRRASP